MDFTAPLDEKNAIGRLEYFDDICKTLKTKRFPDFSFIDDNFVNYLAGEEGSRDLFTLLLSAGYKKVDLDGLNVGSKDDILNAMRGETDMEKLRIYGVLFLSAWYPQLKHLNSSVLGKLYGLL